MDHQSRRAGVLKLSTWPSRGGRHAASTKAKPSLVRAVSTGFAQLPCSATCTTNASLQSAKTQPSDNSLSMHDSARLHQLHRKPHKGRGFQGSQVVSSDRQQRPLLKALENRK